MKDRTRKVIAPALGMLIVTVLIISACGPAAPTPAPAPKPAPTTTQTAAPAPTTQAPKPTTTPTATQTPTPTLPPKPGVIRLSSYGVNMMSYIQDAAVGEGMLKKFNIRLRAMPIGASVSRLNVIRQGTVDIGIIADFFWAMEGLEDYSAYEWGPQQIRMVYSPNRSSSYSALTSATSGIKKMSDVKGKRVAYYVGSPLSIAIAAGCLAFAGLTWDDVKRVDMQSALAGYRSVMEGKTDVTFMSSTAGQASEMEASPGGIYWLPMPIEDKEGWARAVKANPVMYPIRLERGPGIAKQGPTWLGTFGFPIYGAYSNSDENFMYWVTKAYVESFEFYKDATPEMVQFALERSVPPAMPMMFPYHNGAIRYFKERGVWSPQMEKNQKELVARMDKLQQVWTATVNEYLDKKMEEKEFSKFWLQKRAAAFPAYWTEIPAK